MNLRQLEAFRAVMRAGSITGAAESLHVSQPSISRLIGDLERAVGFTLFERAGRGIVPTMEARRFHRSIESMFLGMDRLRAVADTIRSTAGGIVSIGVIPSVSHSVTPEAIKDFTQTHPEVQVMASIRNTPGILEAVQMHQMDIGVVGRAPPYDGVETLFYTAVPYLCLVPETHWAAGVRGALDLKALAETETFVSFGGIYPDEMLDIDSALSRKLIQRSKHFAANMPILASMARATGSLAIVDPFTAETEERIGGLVSRPIKQSLTYHIAVVGPGPGLLSTAARDLAGDLIAGFQRFLA